MLVSFPSPVLSVAADVVRDLDEYEALPGLWTLFTKCKGSLKDGRRLENISWRLWYREMMALSLERHRGHFFCDSEKHVIGGSNSDDGAYRPPTPEEAGPDVIAPESSHLSTLHLPPPPDFLIPTLHPRLSVVPIPARQRPSASSRQTRHGVGRIICDLLPNSLPSEVLRRKPSRQPTSTLPSQPPAMTTQDPSHIKCKLPVVKDVKHSSLPTPSAEENETPALPHAASSAESLPHCQTSYDVPNLTLVQLSPAQDPSTPEALALTILDSSDSPAPVISAPNLNHTSPASSPRNPDLSPATTIANPNGLTLPPPRLIVVNPTPNPTPHPTPPATPVLPNTGPQSSGVLVVPSGNQHLLPPPAFHVVPVQKDIAGPQRRSPVRNDNLVVEVTPICEHLLASAAKTEAPRIPGEDVQVHLPPSPSLTDDAIVPPQSAMQNLDYLDQNQLQHPLTVSTKVEPVTKKPSVLRLVPSSPSVVAHIFGDMNTTTAQTRSPSSSPIKGDEDEIVKETAVVTSPTAESEKATTSPRPGHVRRQNSVGVKASSSGPKKLPRTHSTGNVVTHNNAAGTHTRNGSRSRSRDGPGAGLGLGAGGLVMTRTASNGPGIKAKAKVVGGSKAVTARLGGRKTVEKSKERSKSKENEKEVENEPDKGSLRRPTFNIGSNSDEGSAIGSKSVGSGSEVADVPKPGAGKANEHTGLAKVHEERVKEKEVTEVKQGPARGQMVDDKTILGAQALLEALVPQQQKRIVVASSDSEDDFETDDGSWSSEELSEEDVELAKSGGSSGTKHKPQPQPQPPPQHHQHQHHQHQHQRSPVAHVQVDDAARLKHLPTNPQPPHVYHNDKRGHVSRLSRRQLLLNQAKAHTHSIEQAALEAQRQREMFAKIPTTQNISRTQSVGLLTQLMNPDPHIFHPNHPYRRGFSSTDVRAEHQGHLGQGQFRFPVGLTGVSNHIQPNRSQGHQTPQEPRVQDTVPVKTAPLAAASGVVPPLVAAPEVRRPASTQQLPRQYAAPSFRSNKVSVAMPVASQVQVGSLRSKNSGETGASVSQPGLDHLAINPLLQTNGRPAGGYRPRGRPEDAELEDESGTEEESGIQLSKSVAQEKLRALAARRGIRPNRRASSEDANTQPLPAWAEHPTPQQQPHHPMRPPGSVRMHTTPTPIPQALAHPYNLPLTALPTTPRTTRRHMLQTEMSESLRRNLLWERQVSKNNMLGFRRTASSGGGASGNVLNGIRPLATNDPMPAPPNVVHLTAKGSKNNNNNPKLHEAGNAVQESSKAFARNRSWAGEEDDYHRKGW